MAGRCLITPLVISLCMVSMAACSAWPFSSGPKDIRVTSVTTVDFKDQTQLEWVSLKPRPSKPITRIAFTTSTDLLALSQRKDYNVTFTLGPCSPKGVTDSGIGYGSVFWNTLRIAPDAKATTDYQAAIAKGPPFTYQVYASETPPGAAPGPMCFTLAGGSMIGGKLRSNVARLPSTTAINGAH